MNIYITAQTVNITVEEKDLENIKVSPREDRTPLASDFRIENEVILNGIATENLSTNDIVSVTCDNKGTKVRKSKKENDINTVEEISEAIEKSVEKPNIIKEVSDQLKKDRITRKKFDDRICLFCGDIFPPTQHHQKFCSVSHGSKHRYNQKKQIKVPEVPNEPLYRIPTDRPKKKVYVSSSIKDPAYLAAVEKAYGPITTRQP